MTALTPHMSSAGLESVYKAAANPVANSHFHALWLVSKDYTVKSVVVLGALGAHAVQALQRERP